MDCSKEAPDGKLSQSADKPVGEPDFRVSRQLRRKGASALGATAYVGSYSELAHFLRECHAKGQLPAAKLNNLLDAVEDLSRRDVGESMQSMKAKDRAREQGQEEAFSDIMGNLGIKVERQRPTIRPGRSRGMSTCSIYVAVNPVEFLCDINFDSRSKMGNKKRDVKALVSSLDTPFGLLDMHKLDEDKVTTWMEDISETYTGHEFTSYHNWRHACDVFQFSFLSIHTGGASDYFSWKDILALLLASIAHDAAHPGTNNAFEVNTRSRFALIYNDKSVLENMHASTFFEVHQRPGNNFLDELDKHDFDSVRGKVIDVILATDMSHHFELVDRFRTRVSEKEGNPFMTESGTDKDASREGDSVKATKADRKMLSQAFVHMADLGHCARPWDIHKHLVASLEMEFFSQGDKERELGLPIMPLMDRTRDSAAASQDFFLGHLVLPLLVPYTGFLQEPLGTTLLDNLADNRKKWQDLVKKHGKKTACEIIDLEL